MKDRACRQRSCDLQADLSQQPNAARSGRTQSDLEHQIGIALYRSIMFMIMPVCVCMIMVIMAMRVIVTTPTSGTMHMLMVVMIMTMPVIMPVIMPMSMAVIIMSAPLWLERAHHGRHSATEPAHKLGKPMVFFDINCIGCDFACDMIAAEVKGCLQKTGRIVRSDLDQSFGRRIHQNERTVIKFQRVATVQHRCLFEVDGKQSALLAFERRRSALPCHMIKVDRIDDVIGLHRRLPDNRCRALHEIIPFD